MLLYNMTVTGLWRILVKHVKNMQSFWAICRSTIFKAINHKTSLDPLALWHYGSEGGKWSLEALWLWLYGSMALLLYGSGSMALNKAIDHKTSLDPLTLWH
jgi:hypothetical protein